MKRVTIKEVAERANVAIGTVSRHLNSSGYVSHDAMLRIERAIKDLDYIPNAAARSMINKKGDIIGLTIPEINNPFLADLVVRFEAALTEMNYSVMLCNNQYKSSKVADFIDDLITRDAEGLVLIATDIYDQQIIRKMKNYLCPIFIGHEDKDFNSISSGDYQVAFDLTQHIINLNHQRIGFIGFNENARQTMLRVEGYCAALEAANLPIRKEYMLQSIAKYNDGYQLTKKLLMLEEAPTAIIAINDFYAMNAYSAISDFGLKVSQDISVAGFDDIFFAKLLSPTLTTVSFDSDILVKTAVKMLMNHIKNPSKEPENVMLPSHVVYRESTSRLK